MKVLLFSRYLILELNSSQNKSPLSLLCVRDKRQQVTFLFLRLHVQIGKET